MKKILTIIAFTLVVQYTYAQISNDPGLLVRKGGLTPYIRTFQPGPEIEGEYLYFKEQKTVTLYLKDGKGKYKVQEANIDLINRSVLVDIKNNMYSINYQQIDSAVFEDLRMMDYQIKSSSVNNSVMALVIANNVKNSLYKTVNVKVTKPNYNEILDTGSRNYILNQKVNYFIDLKEEGILDLGKKLKAFKGTRFYDDVKKYVKTNYTDFTSDRDVIRLTEFVATLM